MTYDEAMRVLNGAAGGTVIVLAVAMIAALVFALILSVRLM